MTESKSGQYVRCSNIGIPYSFICFHGEFWLYWKWVSEYLKVRYYYIKPTYIDSTFSTNAPTWTYCYFPEFYGKAFGCVLRKNKFWTDNFFDIKRTVEPSFYLPFCQSRSFSFSRELSIVYLVFRFWVVLKESSGSVFFPEGRVLSTVFLKIMGRFLHYFWQRIKRLQQQYKLTSNDCLTQYCWRLVLHDSYAPVHRYCLLGHISSLVIHQSSYCVRYTPVANTQDDCDVTKSLLTDGLSSRRHCQFFIVVLF